MQSDANTYLSLDQVNFHTLVIIMMEDVRRRHDSECFSVNYYCEIDIFQI